MLKRSLKDISFSIKTINSLIAEEQQAVDLYRQAISECDDPTCLDVYSHILQEEIEHIEELKKLKEDLTQPVEAKDSKFRDSKIKYIVVVNGERYASFDNYEDAVQCENSFYSSMDEDAENYYGSYPDVRIIKEDAYGRRIRDAKPESLETWIKDWINQFLDNDDEITDEYLKSFRKIKNDKALLSKIAKQLKEQFTRKGIEDLSDLEGAPERSELTYKLLKKYA